MSELGCSVFDLGHCFLQLAIARDKGALACFVSAHRLLWPRLGLDTMVMRVLFNELRIVVVT